jgi:hypothetical protein
MFFFECLDLLISSTLLGVSLLASYQIFRKSGSTIFRSALFMMLTGAVVCMSFFWRLSFQSECQKVLRAQEIDTYWQYFFLLMSGIGIMIGGYLLYWVLDGIRRERSVLHKKSEASR